MKILDVSTDKKFKTLGDIRRPGKIFKFIDDDSLPPRIYMYVKEGLAIDLQRETTFTYDFNFYKDKIIILYSTELHIWEEE